MDFRMVKVWVSCYDGLMSSANGSERACACDFKSVGGEGQRQKFKQFINAVAFQNSRDDICLGAMHNRYLDYHDSQGRDVSQASVPSKRGVRWTPKPRIQKSRQGPLILIAHP